MTQKSEFHFMKSEILMNWVQKRAHSLFLVFQGVASMVFTKRSVKLVNGVKQIVKAMSCKKLLKKCENFKKDVKANCYYT